MKLLRLIVIQSFYLLMLSMPPVLNSLIDAPNEVFCRFVMLPGFTLFGTFIILEILIFFYLSAFVFRFSKIVPCGPFCPLLVETSILFLCMGIRRTTFVFVPEPENIWVYSFLVWLPVYPLAYLGFSLFKNRRSLHSLAVNVSNWFSMAEVAEGNHDV